MHTCIRKFCKFLNPLNKFSSKIIGIVVSEELSSHSMLRVFVIFNGNWANNCCFHLLVDVIVVDDHLQFITKRSGSATSGIQVHLWTINHYYHNNLTVNESWNSYNFEKILKTTKHMMEKFILFVYSYFIKYFYFYFRSYFFFFCIQTFFN